MKTKKTCQAMHAHWRKSLPRTRAMTELFTRRVYTTNAIQFFLFVPSNPLPLCVAWFALHIIDYLLTCSLAGIWLIKNLPIFCFHVAMRFIIGISSCLKFTSSRHCNACLSLSSLRANFLVSLPPLPRAPFGRAAFVSFVSILFFLARRLYLERD